MAAAVTVRCAVTRLGGGSACAAPAVGSGRCGYAAPKVEQADSARHATTKEEKRTGVSLMRPAL